MANDCGNVQKVFVPMDKEQKQDPPSITSGIIITDLAAEKIKHFIATDKKSEEEYGLLVKVVTDGCSGKSYAMDLAKIDDNKDAKVFVKDGATVMIDKSSYIFVIGSILEYVETLLMSGFQINNPNVKKSCSCGSSFAV